MKSLVACTSKTEPHIPIVGLCLIGTLLPPYEPMFRRPQPGSLARLSTIREVSPATPARPRDRGRSQRAIRLRRALLFRYRKSSACSSPHSGTVRNQYLFSPWLPPVDGLRHEA